MLNQEEQELWDALISSNLLDRQNGMTFVGLMRSAINRDPENRFQFLEISKKLKKACLYKLIHGDDSDVEELTAVYDIYWAVLLEESFWVFESFILYMEKNRPPEKRFYEPRRETLCVVVRDLQDLEDRVGDRRFYGLSMPSRTGKSTICLFFLAWISMKRPNSHNAMGGHSGMLAKGFYKELLNLIDTPEYTFAEIYSHFHPKAKILRDKSADEFTITLDKPDRFATLTCRGIDGTWTGAVDVSGDGYLYVDDLVRDREHSLSPTRMETTFQEYQNKMLDRMNDGARILMVGTLWNVLDPLERERKRHIGDPRYFFRKIPALDENDESNFQYKINGFSTEYYHEMRARLDDPEWMAKYQQQPYVREGILFSDQELRYFNGILPEGDYRIVSAVDVAWGGGDSLSMPVGAEFSNGDIYIIAWVFNKGTKEVTLPLVAGQIMNNQIRELRFEGNTGGELYCQYVDEILQASGYKCSCTSKKAPNKLEKSSKIIAYSGDIKRKFVFLSSKRPTATEREMDASLGITRYERDKEYDQAMAELTTFVTIGKNEHDDAADGITQLAMFVDGDGLLAQAEPMRRLF